MKSLKPQRLIFWTAIFLVALILPLQFAGDAHAWWDKNYLYRKQITVRNNDSIQLASSTIVSFSANTAALITGGKLRSDGKDWRIVYYNGSTESEIDQLVETGWNSASTETWFRLQAAINAGATNGNYYVYYGYSGESGSPSTFTTSETNIDEQTTGIFAGAEAMDFEDTANGEYGGAQSISIPAGNSRYWKITKFSFYVWYKTSYEAPCSSANDFAAFIFDGTGKKEGDQITNGKSDVADADNFITNFNDLVWSGNKPKIKTGTWYFAVLPTNPAQRNKSGCWFRWDYRSGGGGGAYQIDRAGTWHTANIGSDKRRRYQVYGREAANSDLSATLGGEHVIKRWGEGTCGASCEYTGVTEDTYLDQVQNNYNLGAETELRVGDETGSRADRTMIKFDLSDLSGLIRNSSQIISARLRVRTLDAKAGGGSINVDAFRVKKTWTEGTHFYTDHTASPGEVTYTYQLYNTAAWTGAGCDNSADRQTTADDTVAVSADETWYSWYVTDSVKYMFDHPTEHFGWILKSQSEGTTNCWRFYSSEHETASKLPYLEIVYDDSPIAIYYSVGTSYPNNLYSDTASASSGLLTLDSPGANNIGVGDEIEIVATGDKYYIRGRNSSTQFTIQTATGDTNISIDADTPIYIRRAFGSLSAAYSGSKDANHLVNGNLTGNNYQLNWVCYADNVMNDTLTLSQAGYTTGPNNYIKIYTPTSTSEVGTTQRHNGTWGSGFRMTPSGDSAIKVSEDYVRIEGIAMQATSSATTANISVSSTNGSFSDNNDVRISHCLFYGQTGTNNSRGLFVADDDSKVNVTIFNTIAYNHGITAFQFGGVSKGFANGYCYNCTAYDSVYGILRYGAEGGPLIVKNCVSMGNTAHDYYGTILLPDSDYNMSSDTTAPGTHVLKEKYAVNQFVSIDENNEDFHLKDGAEAKKAGTSLSSYFTDDIDGQTRMGSWDMGADEDDAFEYRRAIIIDHSKVESSCGSNDLLHFPVLISLSNQTWLKTTANGGKIYNVTQDSSGFDIPCDLIFRGSNGRTQLDHEIEKYDGTNGSLIAWVRIPALSKSVDTTIYMYYGDPEVNMNTSNPSGVWDSNFVGVWHLREDPSGGSPQMKDSKGSNHGTYNGNDASGDQVSAQVNGGIDLDGDGDDDYINAANSGSSLNVGQTFTAEIWIKRKTTGGSNEDSLLTKVHGNYYSFKLNITTANYLQMWVNDGGTSVTGGTITDTSDFHYIGGYSDGTNLKVFRDGDIDTGSGSTPSISYDSNGLLMGAGIWGGTLGNYTDATIDEVRISSTARDACWIKTTFNTISEPGYVGSSGKFYSIEDPAGSAAPTGIALSSFEGKAYEGGKVLLKWRTGYEMNNLGFDVYREEGGKKVRLTSEPIKGSALLSGPGNINAGHSYSWWDISSGRRSALSTQQNSNRRSSVVGPRSDFRYWLEDIDLNGTRTLHGPVTPEFSDQPVSEQEESVLLSQLSAGQSEQEKIISRILNLQARLKSVKAKDAEPPVVVSEAVEEKVQAEVETENTEKVKAEVKVEPKAEAKVKAEAKAKVEAKARRRIFTPAEVQWVLAGRPAVKIFVQQEGWVRVSQPDLVAAGLDPKINPQLLRLFSGGVEQPMVVTSKRPGQFGSGDAIEFYGRGLDTPSTDARAYWLVVGRRPGRRVEKIYWGGVGTTSVAASFPFTVEKKPRTIYFAALKNGEADNFFGPLVSPAPAEQVVEVGHFDPVAAEDAVLEVKLQGVTNVGHSVKVLLNDVEVGTVVFKEMENRTARFGVFPGVLREGENRVRLVAQGGAMDISLVDMIRLTYRHTYQADDDFLRFTARGGTYLSLSGFSSSGIRVMDITDPLDIREIKGAVKWQGEGYAVRFQVPGQGERRFLAFTEDRVEEASAIVANEPTRWHRREQGADLVMVAPGQFWESLRPLKALRESQGMNVALVDVEDVYDEFGFGMKSPQAIKDFLRRAKSSWAKTPRFVLLVGDASFDPRNYLGLGSFDLVPTKLVETKYLETASDDWFTDFSGDGLPELAVGRLPVRTVGEASIIVSKIVGYGQSAQRSNEVLLVADMPGEDFDFEKAGSELMSLFPENIKVWGISRVRFSDDVRVRTALLENLNVGNLLVNYVGHGSVEVWRGDIFRAADAERLSNGSRLAFFVNMTCLNGFFQDVYTTSLAEELLKAPGGGAVAVWASSGLTEPDKQLLMNKRLINLLFNGEGLTIGEAAMRAKAATADQDIRKTWVLFGDPSTKLKD